MVRALDSRPSLQNIRFSIPYFRPDSQNVYPISDPVRCGNFSSTPRFPVVLPLLDCNSIISKPHYSKGVWVGVCRPVLKTLTLFQTKIYDFPYPISDPVRCGHFSSNPPPPPPTPPGPRQWTHLPELWRIFDVCQSDQHTNLCVCTLPAEIKYENIGGEEQPSVSQGKVQEWPVPEGIFLTRERKQNMFTAVSRSGSSIWWALRSHVYNS